MVVSSRASWGPSWAPGSLYGLKAAAQLLLVLALSFFVAAHRGVVSAAEVEVGLQTESQVYSEDQKTKATTDQKAVIDSGVVSLNGSSYSGFMAGNPLTLVMFYAPWCYWSRSALPELDAAAKLLSHHVPPVVTAKVDCTVNEDLCNQEYIREYPTIRLYVEGVAHLYEGRRYRSHILHWVDLKVDRDKQITSAAYLDELVSSSNSDGKGTSDDGHVVVVAAIPPDYNRGSFQAVARAFGEEVLFGDTADPELTTRLVDKHVLPRLPEKERGSSEVSRQLKPPFVVVFAPHKDEAGVHIYKGPVGEVKELRAFVRQWLFPVVSLFDAESIGSSFFSDVRPKLLLLLDSNKHEEQLKEVGNVSPKDPLVAAFRAVAEKHRISVAAAVSGNKKNFEKQLMSLLGIEDETLPQVRIMHVSRNTEGPQHPAKKFRPPSPLPSPDQGKQALEDAMDAFVSGVLSQTLSPYFRSETPPDTPEPRGRIRTLVASTFATEVRKEANVLVEFYAPWCGFCRKMEPAYKELAMRVADVSGLLIARIDATRNEVDGVAIAGYPTLYLYRRGDEEPLLYAGDRSTRDMLRWLSLRVRGASPFDPDELMSRDIANSNEKVSASVLEEL
ncbi:thioredoxin, putative [Eimeria acervulina]|uniref:protein disulfide-isomerase n=1 Tax=Eimeria acervulina TaxID=5801 RepID=U6GX23_EIMAC|nr:thioredoxin, putative [Eimeria acervulina]CDI83813.1 thioredoxin, putative [Eimeria acervulina]